jgi:putative redox protein
VKADAGQYAARIQMAAPSLQSAPVPASGMLAHGPHGPVELDVGTLSGGHALHLAVAVCVFNDLLGEASRRGLWLHRLAVVAAGEYAAQPEPFHSTGITYRIDIAGDALEADLRTLVSDVERIAEIPHALRQGVTVQPGDVRINSLSARERATRS